MRTLILLALSVALVACHTIPAFNGEEYDLVMLSEQEAMGAIPAHLRLNPKLYQTAEEARRAAEEEFKNIGEEVDVPEEIKQKAIHEALAMASETVADPIHSDLEGIKVNLGHDGDYAVHEEVKKVPVSKQAVKIEEVADVTQVPEEPQSIQRIRQMSEKDIPLAKHVKRQPVEVKREKLPNGAIHLIEDENMVTGTRPSAPQFPGLQGFPQLPGFPQMQGIPQSQAFSGLPQFPQPGFSFPAFQASNLQAPDVDEQQKNAVPAPASMLPQTAPQMNGFPTLPFMGSMPQFPDMLSQMTKMLQQPGQPGQALPGMPGMQSPFMLPELKPVDRQQLLQGIPQMPQMLPQMMQQMPMLIQQMSQPYLAQIPQLTQQLPQLMQQFPGMSFSPISAPSISAPSMQLEESAPVKHKQHKASHFELHKKVAHLSPKHSHKF